MHRHRMSYEEGPYGFTGPVAEIARQNPAAHGNVRYRRFCSCGAWQDVLYNGCHTERGRWVCGRES